MTLTSIPISSDLLAGVELEPTARGVRPHRLPARVREQFPDPQLMLMEAQPSGVALTFDTAADRIELTLHPTRVAYRGAERARGRVDVVVDGVVRSSDELTGGDTVLVGFDGSPPEFASGPDHVLEARLGPATSARRVEIWLPHNESVEVVGLCADAPVSPAVDDRPRWVHHGSSISHGSNAASPTGIWPVVAARAAGVRLRNLGFGGSAMVDQFTARVIRDTPADVISVKLGINVINADVMRRRAFESAVHGFLDTIRDGHPDVPLLLVSPIHCAIHEHAPGPGTVDPATLGTDRVRFAAAPGPTDTVRGQLDLTAVREVLAGVVDRRADLALRYVDGLDLYGAADEERIPLPDALHPDAEAHELIGTRFAEHLSAALPR